MPHLLSVWPSVAGRLSSAQRVLLLLDYDGTLSPIAPRPELSKIPPETTAALTGLAADRRFVLGIVSGRGLRDVRDRVGIPNIIYAGNHGLEITGAGEPFIHPRAAMLRPALNRISAELESVLSDIAGVIVENKDLSLSVHYRLAEEAIVPQVEQLFNEVVSQAAAEDFRITRGKMVFEVRPNVTWGKGHAIAKLMADCEKDCGEAALPVFFGDDLTDEDGFEAVQATNGIAVFVGPARQATRAAYRVDSPREVGEALALLLRL